MIKVLYILNTTAMGGGNISFINMIHNLYYYGVMIYIAYPEKKIDSVFFSSTKDIVVEYFHTSLYPRTDVVRHTVQEKIKGKIKAILCINEKRLKKEIYELKNIINKVKPDIIHTNVGVIQGGYFAAKEYGIPHVWHIREYQTKDFGWLILPSKKVFESYLHDSYVITITNDLISFFELRDSKKTTCIYNGCFSRKEISSIFPKQHYFLSCSRISPEKCIDETILAFSEFYKNHRDYKLIIAGFGDSEYIEILKELASKGKCETAIEFVGYRSDIRPLLDNAEALIVASRFEGFGRMTAEAAFRGCLVIGKNTGGTKEILDQTGGFLYSGDYSELADKMKAVSDLSASEYVERMKKAQKVAVSLFSNEQNAYNVYSLYKSIVNNKNPLLN